MVLGNPTNPTSVLHPAADDRARWPGRAGCSWWTRRSPTRCPASRSRWPATDDARAARAAQPDQDLGAGRAARRIRPRRPRAAGPAGRAAPAVAGRHPRAGGGPRLLRAAPPSPSRAGRRRSSASRTGRARPPRWPQCPASTVLPAAAAPFLLLRLPRRARPAGARRAAGGRDRGPPRRHVPRPRPGPPPGGGPAARVGRAPGGRRCAAALDMSRRVTARIGDVVAALEAAYPPCAGRRTGTRSGWSAATRTSQCGGAGRGRPGAGDRGGSAGDGAQLLVSAPSAAAARRARGARRHAQGRARAPADPGRRGAVLRAHQRRRRRPRGVRRAGRRARARRHRPAGRQPTSRPRRPASAGSARCPRRRRSPRSSNGCGWHCRPPRGACGPPATRSARSRGWRSAAGPATRRWTTRRPPASTLYLTADLRHHPASEHLLRGGTGAGRRRALGLASSRGARRPPTSCAQRSGYRRGPRFHAAHRPLDDRIADEC